MKLYKPNRISLRANEKIFMNANRMGALKLLTGQSLSFFFCLRFEFMLSLSQKIFLKAYYFCKSTETGAVMQCFEQQNGHRSLYRGPLRWHGL